MSDSNLSEFKNMNLVCNRNLSELKNKIESCEQFEIRKRIRHMKCPAINLVCQQIKNLELTSIFHDGQPNEMK